jgi:DNA polymerase iota
MSGRYIISLDADCFYAQCEEIRQPELKGLPIGVRQKMLVITSNYAARAFGIKKGDSISTCKKKCPHIKLCDGEDLTFYTEISHRFFDFVVNWGKVSINAACPVERLGLDEVFIDVSSLVAAFITDSTSSSVEAEAFFYPETQMSRRSIGLHNWHHLTASQQEQARISVAAMLSSELRRALAQQVGLTTSAGISTSKFLSKMVASEHKPNLQTVLIPSHPNITKLIPSGLTVNKIPGIGFSATQKLQQLGITTCAQLRNANHLLLSRSFDDRTVHTMQQLCCGIDHSSVKASGPAKSIGAEDSYWAGPLASSASISNALLQQAHKLLRKLSSDQARHGADRQPSLIVVSTRRAPEKQGASTGLTSALSTITQVTPEVRAQDDDIGGAHVRRESRQARLTQKIGKIDLENAKQTQAIASRLATQAQALLEKIVDTKSGKPFALHILSLSVKFGSGTAALASEKCMNLSTWCTSSTAVSASIASEGGRRKEWEQSSGGGTGGGHSGSGCSSGDSGGDGSGSKQHLAPSAVLKRKLSARREGGASGEGEGGGRQRRGGRGLGEGSCRPRNGPVYTVYKHRSQSPDPVAPVGEGTFSGCTVSGGIDAREIDEAVLSELPAHIQQQIRQQMRMAEAVRPTHKKGGIRRFFRQSGPSR